MISKAAIRQFLARQLGTFDWLKKYSHAELDAALALLRPIPKFKSIKLWAHQKVCFLILNEVKRFLSFVDMGGGKTLLVLTFIRYRKQCGDKPRVVVFVPHITSVETWVEEVQKHTPELKCVALTSSTKQNLEDLKGEGDLFVICYQSAVAMISEKKPGKKGKTKWNFKAAEVREYFAGFNMLVMDEIHKCKKVGSLTYRMCRAISAASEWVIGLTGTPFGRDLADLWPQFYLVDFGETLGDTLGFYKEIYFEQKKKFWGGFEYKFKKSLLPDLKRTMLNRSISYQIEDLHDMPTKEYVKHMISMPADAEGYIEETISKINDGVREGSYRAVESNYLKLRQLSSGFMTLKGEDSTQVHIKFDENPKLDYLSEMIDSMPMGRKIIIFHHFIYTNFLISERLKEIKMKHARIWSGQRDPIGELRRFKNDPSVDALVINSKSGSSSLNLQIANYELFFEQPDNPIDRQQAERRVWRPGQERRVWINDPLMKGTADVSLFNSNRAGKNLLKSVLGGGSLV